MRDIFLFLSEGLTGVTPIVFYLSAPLLPLCASLAFCFLRAKKYYFFTCGMLHTLFFSACLLRFSEREALLLLSFSVFFCLLFSFIARARRKKKAKKVKKKPAEAFTEEFFKEQPILDEPLLTVDRPQKVIVAGTLSDGNETYSLEKENVNLSHALGVAAALKRANLTVADRLETDAISRSLNLFRAKKNLSEEEVSALNGYLASLLKLMAKYSL